MPIQPTIFWDFDGTLAYKQSHWSGSMLEVLNYNLPDHQITLEQLQPYLQTGFPWHTPNESHHELSSPTVWWKHVENILSAAFSALGFHKEFSDRLAQLTHGHYINPDGFILYPGTIEVLQHLCHKGYQNIILSNHVPELPSIVEQKGLSRFFSHCITSASIGLEKPHIEIYHYALKIANYPKKAIMVGDSISADVKGAENAGIDSILLHTPPDDAIQYFAESIIEAEVIIDQIFSYPNK